MFKALTEKPNTKTIAFIPPVSNVSLFIIYKVVYDKGCLTK